MRVVPAAGGTLPLTRQATRAPSALDKMSMSAIMSLKSYVRSALISYHSLGTLSSLNPRCPEVEQIWGQHNVDDHPIPKIDCRKNLFA